MKCGRCEAHRQAERAEPLMPARLPEGPWQMIGIDLCRFKQNIYITVVDYYSQFFEIAELVHITSRAVLNTLDQIFARHGRSLQPVGTYTSLAPDYLVIIAHITL